jgi:alkaline phosphatase D
MVEKPWPADTYAQFGSNDYGSAYSERKEIYDLVHEAKITGFAIVSGDRHSFWAGYAAATLPPRPFEPVGLSFVGASLASPGTMEALEHGLRKDHPLRALFLADRADGGKPEWTNNMLLRHGVRSCLEYAKSFDLERARALSNPDLAPHLEFVDLGGHGFAKVQLSADEMRTEFVCIPRPITRATGRTGAPQLSGHFTAALWKARTPQLKASVLGDVGLSMCARRAGRIVPPGEMRPVRGKARASPACRSCTGRSSAGDGRIRGSNASWTGS